MDKNKYLDLNITKEFANGHTSYLRPMLDLIIRRAVNQATVILEAGIGTGLCSIFLEKKGFKNVLGFDNEEEIVKKFMYDTRIRFNSTVPVFIADAFDLKEFVRRNIKPDILFHQGLLEHFNEADAIKMLKHHVEITTLHVVFCVPLVGYQDSKDYDEHENRWTLDKWLSIARQFKLYEYGVFGVDIQKEQAYFDIGKI